MRSQDSPTNDPSTKLLRQLADSELDNMWEGITRFSCLQSQQPAIETIYELEVTSFIDTELGNIWEGIARFSYTQPQQSTTEEVHM